MRLSEVVADVKGEAMASHRRNYRSRFAKRMDKRLEGIYLTNGMNATDFVATLPEED